MLYQVRQLEAAIKSFLNHGAPGWLSRQASAFGSGHVPRVLGSSPASGSLLGGKPASPSPTPPACVPSLLYAGEKQESSVARKDKGRKSVTRGG